MSGVELTRAEAACYHFSTMSSQNTYSLKYSNRQTRKKNVNGFMF